MSDRWPRFNDQICCSMKAGKIRDWPFYRLTQVSVFMGDTSSCFKLFELNLHGKVLPKSDGN